MAAGTITRVAVDPHTATPVAVSIGDLKMTLTTVQGNTSYATSGDALTPAQLGLGTLKYAVVVGITGSASNNTATTAQFNNSTGKLQWFSNTDAAGCPLAETASTTNVSGTVATVLAFGY